MLIFIRNLIIFKKYLAM